MNTTARYILLVLGVVITLHYSLTLVHEEYGRATSWNALFGSDADPLSLPLDYYHGTHDGTLYGNSTQYIAPGARANATFVILARNSDLDSTVRSIREMEERFNRKYRYPYVLLNEEEFTDRFKKRISVLTDAEIHFGLVPREHWFQPDSIDEEKASAARAAMVKDNIIYGGSVSYRNMCRFNSGFFFKHPLLQQFKWYWRIEPDVHFHCDVLYDPFVYMEENTKVYGFTIAMYEFEKTIPSLWGHVKDFIEGEGKQYVADDNAMGWISDNGGQTYNLCHFWSNFEIADMDFWRGDAYQAFFNYLDEKGGFYYERWGDAPVHAIAASLFAKKDQLHFFREMGYEHNPYTHCPKDPAHWKAGRCSCDPEKSFDYDGYSCMRQWERLGVN